MSKTILKTVPGLLFLAFVLGFCCFSGCGTPKPDGMPSLQPVTLTVIQDGKPLAEAIVTLKSSDSANKWTSGGTTDAEGKLQVKTHGKYNGIPVGKYKVAVSKVVGEGTPPPPSPIDEKSKKVYDDYVKSGKTYTEFYVVDAKFRLISATSPEIEIKEGVQDVSIDIGAACKEKVKASQGVK